MAPTTSLAVPLSKRELAQTPTKAALTVDDLVLEAWGQGFNVGSLVVLVLLVICNYRQHVILHKLILLELFFAVWHGSFIFFQDPTYGWYLSSTATLLFISYQLHNIISWRKIKPFLPRWGERTFIITIIAVQPFWIVEAWNNFQYFNGLGNQSNIQTRPWEAIARDPWWIFTTIKLIQVIKKRYNFTFLGLIHTSPRFAVMIFCMLLSLVFLVMDIIVTVTRMSRSNGINPYWRLALVFKCASDTIFLDDFKSVLDHIAKVNFGRVTGSAHNNPYTTPRPSIAALPGAGASSLAQKPPQAASGPIVAICSEGGHDPPAATHHHPRTSWKLLQLLPTTSTGGSSKTPSLQIRRDTTITTTSTHTPSTELLEPRQHSTSSQDTILTRPHQATTKPTRVRRPSAVDQWGDVIEETGFNMASARPSGL